MMRLPLSLRLAARRVRSSPVGFVLAALFLALPTTALVVVNMVSGHRAPVGSEFLWDSTFATAAAATLALPLALAITVMVAANLLVAARRDERTLALLRSVGAPSSTLFRVVSANGIISGVAAAVITLVVGIPLSWLWVGAVAPFNAVTVVLLALLAVLFGWVASVVPAIVATQVDTLRVLRGVPSPPSGRWRTDRIGRVLVVIGLGAMILGGALALVLRALDAGQQQAPFFLQAIGGMGFGALSQFGPVIVMIGIALAMPAIFRTLGRLLVRFGLAARLAARDAERGWAKSVSAGATVLATTFAIGMYLAIGGVSSSAQSHWWELQEGQVAVSLIDPGYRNNLLDPKSIEEADVLAAALNSAIELDELRTLDGVQGPFYGWPIEDIEDYSGRQELVFPEGGLPHPRITETSICEAEDLPTWRCVEHHYYDSRYFPLNPTAPTIWVGDIADLRLMLGGTVDDDTRAALANGEAIVFDARYLAADGTVTIDWAGEEFVPEDEPGEFLPAGPPVKSETMAGRLAPLEHPVSFGLFVSKAAAAELGLESQPSRLLGTVVRTLTGDEKNGVTNAMADAVVEATGNRVFWAEVTFESGPSEIDYAWIAGALLAAGGIALGVSLVAVGLARVEGRETDRMLASLGADPRIRRRISAWYAAIVVGVATVSGTVLAAVSATIMTLMSGVQGAQLPWLELGILAFGVPLLAVGVALIPSRSPVPKTKEIVQG